MSVPVDGGVGAPQMAHVRWSVLNEGYLNTSLLESGNCSISPCSRLPEAHALPFRGRDCYFPSVLIVLIMGDENQYSYLHRRLRTCCLRSTATFSGTTRKDSRRSTSITSAVATLSKPMSVKLPLFLETRLCLILSDFLVSSIRRERPSHPLKTHTAPNPDFHVDHLTTATSLKPSI